MKLLLQEKGKSNIINDGGKLGRKRLVMNIDIALSNSSTPSNVINELMKIEADAYSPEYRGKYKSIERRFQKFREMFILAYDNSEIVGYLCYFPISNKLHNELILDKGFHDDNITPKDIKSFEDSSNIYLLSIAIYQRYQGYGIGNLLMEAFENKLRQEKEKGNAVEDIIASTVSTNGENLLKRYGFQLVNDYSITEHYKLYKKNGNNLQ